MPKASASLLVLVLSLAALPAAGQDPGSELDAPYELLDLAETETGILANRRSVFLDPGLFQGTTAADTLRPMQWEVLFGQLRMSAADPSVFPTPASLAALAQTEREAGRLPIALLYQRFDYISEAPLQDGRLEVDDSGPVPQVYRPVSGKRQVYTMPSPYAQASAFAAGALYGGDVANALNGPFEAGATATFVVPSGLFVVPEGTTKPTTVEVDPGGGGGYRTVSLGQALSVVYNTPGEKTVQVRATVAGATRYARFLLRVRESTGGVGARSMVGSTPEEQCEAGAVASHWAPGRVHCGVVPVAQYAWAAPRNYANVLSHYDGQNRVANYDYAVSLAPGHSQITKPIIVVSGYDPFEDTGLDEIYRRLVQYDDGITVGPEVDLTAALKVQGYDIVVMDYVDSQDFIQRNALALVDLIGKVHAEMDANPNAVDEIGGVIGLSMGGLVARYALAYMEVEMQVDHRVHLFASYDSPQQGAYVPAGLGVMFADVYGFWDGVLGIFAFFDGDVEAGIDFIE